DYLLPVEPIARYQDTFDDQGMPRAIVPAQPIEPWLGALDGLLTDASLYEAVSSLSHRAATAFVEGLDAGGLCALLAELDGASSAAPSPRQPAPDKAGPGPVATIAELSPVKRSLLADRIRGAATPAAKPTVARAERTGAEVFPL